MVNLKSEKNPITGKIVSLPSEKWVRVENTHEAIVTKEEFETVQKSLKICGKRSAKPIKIHYRCGCCGRHLERMKQGTLFCRVERYTSKKVCDRIHNKKAELDHIVLGELKQYLRETIAKDKLKIKKQVSEKAGRYQDGAVLQKAIESANQTWMKLYEDYREGRMDRETFREKKKYYDQQVAELEAKLVELQKIPDMSDQKSKCHTEYESILDIEELTDEIWDKFISDVRVFAGPRLEITWKFDKIGEVAV